jgi:hypothetical protein
MGLIQSMFEDEEILMTPIEEIPTDDCEVTEMIMPSVIGGRSLAQPDMLVTITEPLIYQEITEEHVERGDFQVAAAWFAENLPEDQKPFAFVLPQDGVITAIAKQANNEFAKNGWKKRLAIVGFADSKKDAPYDDPTWEIWGLNDLHNSIKRFTRWFDIHTTDNINEDVKLGRSPPDRCGIGGLARLQCPVYMQDRNADVPNSIKYPLQEILATFKGFTGDRYFTNSISYMLAFALYEGIISGRQWDEIKIFGVDMAVGPEYIAQRPSCEYWIGVAEGMGVKMFIPDASDLNKTTFLYGFEEKLQKKWETKIDESINGMTERMNQINNAVMANQRSVYQHEGAIGCMREFKKVWANLDTKL